jgi:hypothetical protein
VDNRSSLPVDTVVDGSYRIRRIVGAGGFGITYEAEDLSLGTRVALKEYYPADFGDRDTTLSVHPKSHRHRKAFEWGRDNFLNEARMLARFEHPSIVRVTRIFLTNATAYMVMRFEEGQSFAGWLKALDRPPTQGELDALIKPLLDAVEIMHSKDFLHRDIAPDNIIVRADGTPVLLDFGAARRAVAEISRRMTGIVKAGYSPHEQYSSDSRLQGPWSDIYALGATLYLAVTGRPPEEATLRVDQDHMPSALQAASRDRYRQSFLAAIDACLKVRYAERPQSVAEIRPMLLDKSNPTGRVTKPLALPRPVNPRSFRRWTAMAAGIVAMLGGALGGYHFMQYSNADAVRRAANEARLGGAARVERNPQRLHDAKQEQEARLEAETKRLADVAGAARAQAEAEKKRSAEADAKHQEETRIAEERSRQEAEGIRVAEAARQRAEADRVAAEDAARQRAEAERVAAATLSAEDRASFVRRVQEVLKASHCSDGAINGSSIDAQKGVDRFVETARKKGKDKPAKIELAKATASDFDAWLHDANDLKTNLCFIPTAKAERKVAVTKSSDTSPRPDRPRRAEPNDAPNSGGERRVKCWSGRTAISAIGCRNGTQ